VLWEEKLKKKIPVSHHLQAKQKRRGKKRKGKKEQGGKGFRV